MAGKKWSSKEDQFIVEHYNRKMTMSIDTLHDLFKAMGWSRSRDALRNRAWHLRHDKKEEQRQRTQKWFEGMEWGHLDIETTNFNANFGHMLSWAMYVPEAGTPNTGRRTKGGYLQAQPKDGKAGAVWYDVVTRKEVINYDKQDKRISQTLINAMSKVDMLVTYYGTGFDIKFMRSRALYWGQDFPTYGQKFHLDMYYRARSLGKLHRNSLGAHTQFLGIDGKNHVLGEEWGRARCGEPAALKYVVDHNVEDVVILEELYQRYKPFFNLTKKSI